MNTCDIWVMVFLVVYGAAEVFSNLYHLTRGSADKIAFSAKKQHGELPYDLPQSHYIFKASVMLVMGMIFLGLGAMMALLTKPYHAAVLGVFTLHGLYGLGQAVVYRRCWRVLTAGIVYNIPLVTYWYYLL